ncbi:hypothetical protein ACFU8X_16430 [Brevibacillus porteri]|uniref:hypothetical protein n=1 Tax=Brevibacillus porteri TaxID=2126350 RepID=UPI00370B847F
MEWQEMIRIWNQTPVKLLDIRHIVMKPSVELQSYRMPANAFLFIKAVDELIEQVSRSQK